MAGKIKQLKAGYSFNLLGYIVYYGVLLLTAVLIITWIARQPLGLKPLYDHTSNLVISLTFLLSVGGALLYKNHDFRNIVVLAMILVMGNFVVETIVALGNTRDIQDAVAGTVGVAVAFIVLVVLKAYGSYSKTVS